jgi:S-adenosylmethionine decarboxylase
MSSDDASKDGSTDQIPEIIQPQTPPHYFDDDGSGDFIEREYTGKFEGPEKTLEVVFRRKGDTQGPETVSPTNSAGHGTPKLGLRSLSRDDIDLICARARVTILSRISNTYLDAYVLSESSLFVYPYMLVLKTCGTTTLLRCISVLIDLGHKLGLEIDWVGYSRKNFNFPGDQSWPHQSFHQELEYLYSHRKLCDRLDGNGYTLGPVTSDHWFVYVADHTIRSQSLETDTDRVLNIMMFDIDADVSEIFYYNNYDRIEGESKEDEVRRISKEQSHKSGIDALCPGAIMDARAFEPCGYSMNAVLFRSYSTIHITPEMGSSYVSFETNQKVASYNALISNVLRTFCPRRFVMTLMADDLGLRQIRENPLTGSGLESQIVVPAPRSLTDAMGVKKMMYKRSTCASIKVEDDCCCMMGNWVLKTDASPSQIRANKKRGMTLG